MAAARRVCAMVMRNWRRLALHRAYLPGWADVAGTLVGHRCFAVAGQAGGLAGSLQRLPPAMPPSGR